MLRKGQFDDTFSRPTPGDEDNKKFLSGTVERRLTFTAGYSMEFAKDQFIQIEIGALDWKNYNRVEGDDRNNSVAYLSYKLDF